jgi:uncharacterized membrane protein YhaH (DUF805 family)
MSTKFNLDKKLFANSGAIGRRTYMTNMSILFVAVLIITIPCTLWIGFSNCNFDVHFLRKLYYSAPFVIQSFLMFALCTSAVIGISNIKRRLTDICGKDIEFLKYIVCASYIIFLFSFFLPFNIALITISIFLAFSLLLISIKGKISPQLQESVVEINNK